MAAVALGMLLVLVVALVVIWIFSGRAEDERRERDWQERKSGQADPGLDDLFDD